MSVIQNNNGKKEGKNLAQNGLDKELSYFPWIQYFETY
jgi:hypothetical protein